MSFCAVASVAEDPGAEKPHARIRTGGIEQSVSLLRSQKPVKKVKHGNSKKVFIHL